MIIAQILGERVKLHGGAWSGKDRVLVEMLDLLAAWRLATRAGPVPDSDRDIVDDALLRLGGRIVTLGQHRGPDAVPGRVY